MRCSPPLLIWRCPMTKIYIFCRSELLKKVRKLFLSQMPPKLIWGCPMTKICIFLWVKNDKNWKNNSRKKLKSFFLLQLTPKVPSDQNAFCVGQKCQKCQKQKNKCQKCQKLKNKCQKSPIICFATNAPKSHLGVTNDQNLHMFGDKISAPCCY